LPLLMLVPGGEGWLTGGGGPLISPATATVDPTSRFAATSQVPSLKCLVMKTPRVECSGITGDSRAAATYHKVNDAFSIAILAGRTITTTTDIVLDSERRGFIGALPPRLRPYASLMRLDRPIGTWLLYWPCAWSVALAGVDGHWQLFLWLFLGAFAMRSAGCVYNDIVDKDLDRSVERTRLRPLASGRVSLQSAWILVGLLCLIGVVVLLQLKWVAAVIALASLAPVAAYPFMKRITWWPQAWLGLVFSWGALVGWPAVTGSLALPAILLWFGSIAWVVGYDTLYAIQDIEDDELVGVKSSARRLGDKAPLGVGIFYAIALLLWGAAIWMVRHDLLALLTLAPAALHLANQALRADPKDGDLALRLFRSNRTCGLLVFLAILVVGLSAR
jgi:4-hydroxybenzoate polyprenyltransferase